MALSADMELSWSAGWNRRVAGMFGMFPARCE
jgi:hypothetical protein